jgi:hypothetical protein
VLSFLGGQYYPGDILSPLSADVIMNLAAPVRRHKALRRTFVRCGLDFSRSARSSLLERE